MILWVLLFVAIAFACILYRLFHVTLPPNVEFSTKMKISCSIVNAFETLGLWLSKFGVNKWSTLTFKPPNIQIPFGLKKETKMFGGIPVVMIYPDDYMRRKDLQQVIIFYHGGGWTLGSAEMYSRLAINFCQYMDTMIVLPDYRLAPAYPFPVPYQDCLDATKELLDRAEEYNIDREKVILSGDSAGGNLCVAIALVLSVRILAPIYPTLQFSNLRLPSYLANKNYMMLKATMMGRFMLAYMGLDKKEALLRPLLNNEHTKHFKDKELEKVHERVDPTLLNRNDISSHFPKFILSFREKKAVEKYREHIQKLITDPRMAPLVATDEALMNLPPTHVFTCQYDVLHDDGIMLVERLKKLGKKVSHQNMEFGIHGMFGSGISFNESRTLAEVHRFHEAIKTEMNSTS